MATLVKKLPKPRTFSLIGLYFSWVLFTCRFLNLMSKYRVVPSEATNEKLLPTRNRYSPSFVTILLIFVALNLIFPYSKLVKSDDVSDLLADLSLWFSSFCS